MTKSRRNIWIAITLAFTVLCGTLVLLASRSGHLSIALPIAHKPVFESDSSSFPSKLRASGNHLMNAEDQTVMLHGVMPSDPAVLSRKGQFQPEFFRDLAVEGANVVRIPIHPERWERDPDYLWRYLDPIVAWNGENGIYTIIDLHFIGNIATSSGMQMPDIRTPSKEFALDFWRVVAAYFKNAPHVIYEIFNEPAEISAADWRINAQDLVDAIRGAGADQLIIVGGVEYSRNLSWVLQAPIEGENIAYAAHIYPAHSSSSWDYWFGDISKEHPVLVTEWGWEEKDLTGEQPYLIGSQSNYGEPLLDYLDQHGIGWVACWYDDEWAPAMFTQYFKQLTPFGKFIQGRFQDLSHTKVY